ncbi:MAG: galactose-1-phosphate uridylyltransferase [Candidatus Omnitrophica bacterium]|nr:galactose-1-phosphate uridylyltransferase [Candidatus Omnitrophota bacterium]
MTELRRDPVIGQWVNVHTDDSFSPQHYEVEDQTPRHKARCQFCPGREHQTPPEVDAVRERNSAPNGPGWTVRVVPNKFPALKIEGGIDSVKQGMFDMSNGIGAHEVLIETPEHGKNLADFTEKETADVIRLYQNRLRDLTNDRRFKYIIIFKNYGESAGTSVEHAHSQIIALPMIPKYVLEKIEGAKAYYEQNKRCVFCDMVAQEHEDKERIFSENEDFVAFCPFVSRYAFEYWIMPKEHDSNFAQINDKKRNALANILRETLSRLKNCLSDPSYNYYLHVAPVNTGGEEGFHWHIEIVPKLTRTSGFELGTGFYVVRTSPEAAAGYLRGARPKLAV